MAHPLPSDILDGCSGLIYCTSKWAFDVTQGLFWVMALIGFSVIIMIASISLGTRRAFGFASFVGLVGSIWLATLQLMSWWIASAFILVGLIGLAQLIIESR